MTRTRQGGSVRNFIIVAVVLLGLLAVGLYVVRQQTTSEELLPEETTVIEDDKSEPVTEEVVPESVSALPGAETAEQLPQTGPAETISGTIVLGILSLVVASYVRSRRAELSL